jgi:hypothetical protein
MRRLTVHLPHGRAHQHGNTCSGKIAAVPGLVNILGRLDGPVRFFVPMLSSDVVHYFTSRQVKRKLLKDLATI